MAKPYVQFLDQNNPKSKYQCKNEMIYMRDFEAVQKTRISVLSGMKTRDEYTHSWSFFKQYLTVRWGAQYNMGW